MLLASSALGALVDLPFLDGVGPLGLVRLSIKEASEPFNKVNSHSDAFCC